MKLVKKIIFLFVVLLGINEAQAACGPIFMAQIDSFSHIYAGFKWTPATGSVEYEYAITQSSTPPSSGILSTQDTFCSTNMLTPNTTYYFHLRNNCGVNGNSNWLSFPFTTLSDPASVNGNNFNSGSIVLFPNPSRNTVVLEYNKPVNGRAIISDALGRTIEYINITDKSTTIDISGFPIGTYYLHFAEEDETATMVFQKI